MRRALLASAAWLLALPALAQQQPQQLVPGPSLAPIGTSGATIPLNNTANTENAKWTFASGLTINQALVPATSWGPSTLGLYINQTVSGTNCATGGNCFYNLIQTTGDSIPGTPGAVVSMLSLGYTFGGGTLTGNRSALSVGATMTAATGNTGAQSYGALSIGSKVLDADGGTGLTLGTSKGQNEVVNFVMTAGPSATNWNAWQGGEVDMLAQAGSSSYEKSGWQIVELAGDAVAGSVNDAALVFANGSGAVGWKNGIVFGGFQGYWPFQSTATIVGCPYGCGTVANVLDFSGATISGYFLHGPSFSVDGTGNATVGGTLGVTGAATLSGGLGVTGGNATVAGNAIVTAQGSGGGLTVTTTTGNADIYIKGISGSASGIILGPNGSPQWTLQAGGSGSFVLIDAANSSTTAIACVTTGPCTFGENDSFVNKFYGSVTSTGTPPTETTGTCSISTNAGGRMAGSITIPAGGCTTTKTVILTGLPSQTNGYACDAHDETTRTALFNQSAHSATSVTFTIDSVNAAAADVVVWKCIGF